MSQAYPCRAHSISLAEIGSSMVKDWVSRCRCLHYKKDTRSIRAVSSLGVVLLVRVLLIEYRILSNNIIELYQCKSNGRKRERLIECRPVTSIPQSKLDIQFLSTRAL
jgi:hypothetical protein